MRSIKYAPQLSAEDNLARIAESIIFYKAPSLLNEARLVRLVSEEPISSLDGYSGFIEKTILAMHKRTVSFDKLLNDNGSTCAIVGLVTHCYISMAYRNDGPAKRASLSRAFSMASKLLKVSTRTLEREWASHHKIGLISACYFESLLRYGKDPENGTVMLLWFFRQSMKRYVKVLFQPMHLDSYDWRGMVQYLDEDLPQSGLEQEFFTPQKYCHAMMLFLLDNYAYRGVDGSKIKAKSFI